MTIHCTLSFEYSNEYHLNDKYNVGRYEYHN